MENLFENVMVNTRKMAETAHLEEIVAPISNEIIVKINSEEFLSDAANRQKIIDSKNSHATMVSMLEEKGLTERVLAETEWLKDCDAAKLDGMLKSQQSKRSRARKANLTIENYRRIIDATLCEQAIRKALGKEKIMGVAAADYTSLVVTDELREKFKDQDALRREIRNTQSKKSIMKRRAGFSEEDPSWVALVKYEQDLKALRVSTNAGLSSKAEKAIGAVAEAKEALGEVDNIDNLKAGEARELLKKLQEALAAEF